MQRALEQVAAGHRPPDLERVALVGGADHLHGNGLRRPFGVVEQLAGQVRAHLPDPGSELLLRRGRPAGPAGQQQHRVVGGHAAVGVDPVEGGRGGRPQRPLQVRGGHHRVGGEDDEHGGQRRRQHARALGHPAHHVPVGPPRGLLRPGVGGHHRAGGGEPAVAGQRGGGPVHAVQQPGDGQSLPDQAGGADGHLARADTEPLGHPLRGAVRVLEPGRAGAGVGAAGVEHHRGQAAGAQHLLGPQHRGGLDPVGGEHPGRVPARPVVDHQGDVGTVPAAQAGGHPGGPEAGGARHAHGVTLMGPAPRWSARPPPAGPGPGWRTAPPGRRRP